MNECGSEEQRRRPPVFTVSGHAQQLSEILDVQMVLDQRFERALPAQFSRQLAPPMGRECECKPSDWPFHDRHALDPQCHR